jgi:hypothetical protein
MTLDDLLERAWSSELYTVAEDLGAVGVDYWMPLSFSAYPEESHLHQYYQTCRTLYCTSRSQAWWTTGDHGMPGVNTDDLIVESATAIPQLIFNTQFAQGADALRFTLSTFKHYHALLPEHVGFWLVGATQPTFVHNVRRLCGTRPLYYFSSKPLYLASKGQELLVSGKNQASRLPKHELVQRNYEAFASMIKGYG